MKTIGVASNLWKLTLHFVTNKRVFWPILGAYFIATVPGSTAKHIGIMMMVSSASTFILEVPSGYLADKIGHKKTLIIGRICMVLSSASFLIGWHNSFFYLGGALMAVALAFQSGTTSAFVHETLEEMGQDERYAEIMGRMRSIGFAVPIALIVALPFLTSINYRIPFAVGLVTDLIGVAAVLSLVTPRRSHKAVEEISSQDFRGVLREGLRSGFYPYALFSAFIGATAFSVGAFKDVYQQALQVPVIWYGVFFGISRVFISLLLAFSGKIKKRFSWHAFLFAQIFIYGMLTIGLGLTTDIPTVVILLLLVASFSNGLGEIENGYLLKIIKTSHFKATLLSLKSLANALFRAGIVYVFGLIVVATSYRAAYLRLSIFFLAVSLALYVFIVFKPKLRAEAMESGLPRP